MARRGPLGRAAQEEKRGNYAETIGGRTVRRITLQPGWRWPESVQPIVNARSCEAPHFRCHVSGVLKMRTDEGAEFELLQGAW